MPWKKWYNSLFKFQPIIFFVKLENCNFEQARDFQGDVMGYQGPKLVSRVLFNTYNALGALKQKAKE